MPVIFSELTNKKGTFNKRVTVDSDGKVKVDSAAKVFSAKASTKILEMDEVAQYMDDLGERHTTALVLGIWRDGYDKWEEYDIEVSDSKKINPDAGVIARNKNFFSYANNDSTSLMLLDFDGDHSEASRNTFLFELEAVLKDSLIGEQGHEREHMCKWTRGSSSSSSSINGKTGNGLHVYIAVKNAKPELIQLIHRFCWMQDYGKDYKMTAAGTVLAESLVDPLVGSPERVVYSADMTCDMTCDSDNQDVFQKVSRSCYYTPGGVIDCESAIQILRDLTIEYEAEWRKYKIRLDRSSEVLAARKQWKAEQIEKKIASGMTPKEAKKSVAYLSEMILSSNELLLKTDGTEVLVKDILLDPDEWSGVKGFCDPIHRDVYRNVGVILTHGEDTYLYSKSHGEVKYKLQWDYADLTDWVETCDSDELDDWFAEYASNCVMSDIKMSVISKIVSNRLGSSATAVVSDMKRAKKDKVAMSEPDSMDNRKSISFLPLETTATHGDIIDDYIARAGDCKTFGDGLYVWENGTIWTCQNRSSIIAKVRDIYNHVSRCTKTPDYSNLASAILAEDGIRVEKWDEAVGFPCSDGFYSVTDTGIEKIPYTKELGCRFKMSLKPSNMTTPLFDKILDNVENKILFQQLFGLALCAKLPEMQKAFIMVGDGGAGKGTCSDILAAMLPKSRMTSMSLEDLNKESYRVNLADARVNFTSEVSKKRLDLTGIKEALGGGLITGRALYSNPVQFYPNCTFIISMNYFFPLGETGSAVHRRFGDTIVKFTKNHDDQIEGLAKKIIEYELPGVLAWAIEGVRLWIENGLDVELSHELYENWLASVDALALFLEETVIISTRKESGSGVKRSELWKSYVDFCEQSGYFLCKKGEFFAKMEADYPQADLDKDSEMKYMALRWKIVKNNRK